MMRNLTAARRRFGGALAPALACGVLLATGLAGCAGTDEARAYRDYTNFMTNAGRFRQERAPIDAPYGPSDLIRNFEKVAFVPEKQLERFYRERLTDRRLSKWDGPIAYRLFGDGVRDADRLTVAGIMATLSMRSGLQISETDADADLAIFILSSRARRLVAEGEAAKPWYNESLFRDWIETLNPPCFALFDASTPTGGRIRSGAVFIKSEMENPLRSACLVEELTQTMGLIFDHDDVRPSIFNDDQEFIALTEHDEALIEILYDPRLRPGMTRAAAAPIVRRIVAERVGDG